MGRVSFLTRETRESNDILMYLYCMYLLYTLTIMSVFCILFGADTYWISDIIKVYEIFSLLCKSLFLMRIRSRGTYWIFLPIIGIFRKNCRIQNTLPKPIGQSVINHAVETNSNSIKKATRIYIFGRAQVTGHCVICCTYMTTPL